MLLVKDSTVLYRTILSPHRCFSITIISVYWQCVVIQCLPFSCNMVYVINIVNILLVLSIVHLFSSILMVLMAINHLNNRQG